MKRWIAWLLAASLLLALTGCGTRAEEETPSPTPEVTEAPVEETPTAGTEDGEAETPADPLLPLKNARARYDADTVVLTIAGEEITWDLYYYVLLNYLYSFASQLGYLPEDFTLDIGGMTMDEYARQVTEGYLRQCVAIFQHGEGLVDEEAIEEQVQQNWTQLCEANGGEETALALLDADGVSRRAYDTLTRTYLAFDALESALYGEGGSELDMEEIERWASEQNLVRCKHILLLTNGEDMTEEAKEKLKADMEGYLAELRGLLDDPEALEARFDGLMKEHSEDTGLALYPDGYLFGKGEMMQEFEDAAFALEPHALSEVVETSYGYHILLRLPLEREMVAGIDQSSYTTLTLQQRAADELFVEQLAAWREELDVAWSEEFAGFTIQSLLEYGAAPEETPAA